MGLFDSWFGRGTESAPRPKVDFGRFSDRYKTKGQYEAWQRCLDRFDEGRYFEAYGDFFDYLRSPEVDNVFCQRLGDTYFSFELLQGSQRVAGYADGRKFRAEAKVAKADALHLGFMRRLLEKNFALRYSRFSLDESGDISIVFDTYMVDGSPQKLYHALRELSTQADKMDDLLALEFSGLHRIRHEHLNTLPDEWKTIKYDFSQSTLSTAISLVDHGPLEAQTYPQAISYILLDAIYKVDYLTKPEGYTMDVFERINRDYFQEDKQSISQKNKRFKKELQDLLERPKEIQLQEMYGTVSTFGLTQVVDHQRLAGFIDEVMKEHEWYMENGYSDAALAISGYIVGYSLFYWAVPRVDKELLHLYYEIMEPDYFQALGFDTPYSKNGKLSAFAIRRGINNIIKKHRSDFHILLADTSLLHYGSRAQFADSFLMMIHEMEVEEK